MNNNIVFGKSGYKDIVGLEVSSGQMEIFTQQEDGSVVSRFEPVKHWILSNEQISKNAKRLEGDLHYKWGQGFDSLDQWRKMSYIWKKMNKDIYTIHDTAENAMTRYGICFYQGLKLTDISLLSFDLETTGLDGLAQDAKILLISTTFRDKHSQCNKLFSYDDYENEAQLIDAFCSYVREKDPSLLVGHNLMAYDFPYLRDRAQVNNTSLLLGRDESEATFQRYDSKLRLDGTRDLLYKYVHVYGREIVDTFMLAISFDVSKSMETYALKPLIKQLGFEKKDRQHYDAGSIRKNYLILEEWKKIKQYAIDDAEDALRLWDHMGPLYFNMAPMMSKPFTKILTSASGSKINGMLVRAYLQDGHSIPKANESAKFRGALSWGNPGIYRNVKKIDVVAMYPNIILEYSVYDSTKDPKGYVLELVTIFMAKRLEYKRLAEQTKDRYWKEMDTTAKGILNSFFGFFGCPGLNFNNYECADFITEKGREILEKSIEWATGRSFKENAPDYFEDENEEETEE